jgi:hypothetical protein
MGIRFLLVLAAIVGIMWYLSWYHRASPEDKQRSLRSALLYGIGAALLLLVVSGKIPWLFAIFSAAVPWINRVMTARKVWTMFSQRGQSKGSERSGGEQDNNAPRSIENMTQDQALDILGLDENATRQDIVDAHRKLISRVHPDKGGSDYLASSINQARKVLLPDK